MRLPAVLIGLLLLCLSPCSRLDAETLAATPVAAPGSEPGTATVRDADRSAIEGVIRAQMDAFRRDDAATAFGFASPTLQGIFETPARFLAMVRSSYQPVYRPRSVAFTVLVAGPAQRVELIGPDGLGYTATYTMEKQPNGAWRISGCTLVQSKRVET